MSVKQWIDERINPKERDKYLVNGKDFIPEELIQKQLQEIKAPDKKQFEDILAKSLSVKTLLPQETAMLLAITDEEMMQQMQKTALQIKKKVYDNRIVTFAPLYLSNMCVNNCLYCGFRTQNSEVTRNKLSLDEVKKETEILAGEIGHKRLIVVYGEHPESDIEYMEASIKEIYKVKVPTKQGYGNIRRVNVNAAPLSGNNLKRLKDVGIGTYQVFQETYHKNTYAQVHPNHTLKSDYRWRLYAMHRAMEAGVDDVGLGALFGIYDWKFEVMALLYHSIDLERLYGVGPHTISFPRLEPAYNAPYIENSEYKVSDEHLKRIITILRLSVPHTGMILTARETPEFRHECIKLGITQIDASTKIGLGAYSEQDELQEKKNQQFMLGDTRSLDECIRELAEMGYITSFCTAGYRCGRTGECIFDLLRKGEEGKFCKLNAVLTFREWLNDFATEETKIAGEKVLQEEIQEIKEQLPSVFETFMKYYERIEQGERDLYF